MHHIHLEQLALAVTRLLGLGAAVGILTLGLGAVPFAASQMTVTVLAGATCGIFAARLIPRSLRRTSHASMAVAARIFRPGRHFLLLSLSGALIWSTDNIVISMFLNTASVTPYAVSFRLVIMTITMLGMGIGAVTPTITALWATKDNLVLCRLLLQTMKLGMGATSLVCIVLGFFGRDFIGLWAGPEAVVSPEVMWVFVATLYFVALTMGFEVFLIATSRHAVYAYVSLFEGILNLGISLLLVQHLNLLGVAIGTLSAHLATSAWFVPWTVTRTLGLGAGRVTREVFAPLVIPTVLSVVCAIAIAHFGLVTGWISWLLAAGSTSSIFVIAYGVLSINEWEKENALRAVRTLRDWLSS
jgi:O-antigen/teichoic acid export membrane protein